MTQKDASYHEAAIQYNESLAGHAEDVAKELDHPEVARWSRSVAKQHRFHAGRHRKALEKIQSKTGPKTVETEDGGEDAVIDETSIDLDASAPETPAPVPTAPSFASPANTN